MTSELFISLKNSTTPSKFSYVRIPTQNETNNRQTEMTRYCSPLNHSKWALLGGFHNAGIWVLQLNTSSYIHMKQQGSHPPPYVSLNFPSFVSLENRVDLEEAASYRHKCSLIPCSEFSICPTTFDDPIDTDTHLHCMSNHCVRYYEKISMESN